MFRLYGYLAIYDGHHIRLLHLEGADPASGRMTCRLETVRLRDAPAYWAPSYCWGDPGNPPRIVCKATESLDIL